MQCNFSSNEEEHFFKEDLSALMNRDAQGYGGSEPLTCVLFGKRTPAEVTRETRRTPCYSSIPIRNSKRNPPMIRIRHAGRRVRRAQCLRSVECLEGRQLLTAGTLDTTFGGTGMVTTAIGVGLTAGTTLAQSNAVAVQADSKVVVVGQCASPNSYTYHFTIARYNTDGSLDTSFANGGTLILPAGSGVNSYAYGVAIQPDGKMLVSGTADTTSSGSTWTIVRLNSNGTLDTTFGGTGEVFTSFMANGTPGPGYAYSIATQADGTIVVSGDAEVSSTTTKSHGVVTTTNTYAAAVACYNADGSLDTTFGNGGKVTNTNLTVTGNSTSYAQSMLIDTSGRIDVAGQATINGVAKMAVERYLPNGTLDSTFGTGGIASDLVPGSSSGAAYSIGLQSTGKIVVSGYSPLANYTNPPPLSIIRFNTNGSLDGTFGVSGVYTDSRLTTTPTLIIQPADDKILAVARPLPNGIPSYQFALTRVLADGSSVDTSFGTNGIGWSAFTYAGSAPRPNDLALAPGGDIVVTGYYHSNSVGTLFATARFLGDSPTSAAQPAHTSTQTITEVTALDPTLVILALDDTSFVASLPATTRRKSATMAR